MVAVSTLLRHRVRTEEGKQRKARTVNETVRVGAGAAIVYEQPAENDRSALNPSTETEQWKKQAPSGLAGVGVQDAETEPLSLAWQIVTCGLQVWQDLCMAMPWGGSGSIEPAAGLAT